MSTEAQSLADQFPNAKYREFRGQRRLEIEATAIAEVMRELKEVGFDYLVDVTCVDYLQYRADRGNEPAGRFGLAYLLANTTTAERVTVRAYVDDEDAPTVASIVPLWEGANWLEREVYDMFGIHFEGHPDLRRILMPEEFSAHPLRKDYPLQGRGDGTTFLPLRGLTRRSLRQNKHAATHLNTTRANGNNEPRLSLDLELRPPASSHPHDVADCVEVGRRASRRGSA